MAFHYFQPASEIWLNSLGISLIVGFALFLSTGPLSFSRIKQQFWTVFRLFLCPFLVSSYSALVKGKGFSIVFSPVIAENLIALSLCLGFILFSKLLKMLTARPKVPLVN